MTEVADGRGLRMPGTSPVVLVILDGWGLSDRREGNAPHLAATPNFDRIWATRPRARLKASGPDVGLPPGQVGNSEVGHMNIGAGRVVTMDLPKIDAAIADGSFAVNPELLAFAERLRVSGGTAHVLGLISPGGVHSHQAHIAEAARALARLGVPVRIHAFLDGRDVAPTSAPVHVARLIADVAGAGDVRIATLIGRFHALDRDTRWDRVETTWRLIVEGEGRAETDPLGAIAAAHARGETDEFVGPIRIGDHAGVRDGDGILFTSFRADRAREILGALLDPEFQGFPRPRRPKIAAALGLVEYSDRLNRLMQTMFPSETLRNTLGQWVAAQGRRQFRVAETEKYPHVTFFLNGGVEAPNPGEVRHLAPSPRVRTYDLAPEMAAGEVAEALVGAIRARHDLIVVNFANPDMVGHTGSLTAAIAACEAVDRSLGRALEALAETGGAMLVTADHGNAEQMIDPATGGPHTAHTTNEVPLVLVEEGPGAIGFGLSDGRLGDLAPTVLALMGLEQPAEMTGRVLLTPGARARVRPAAE